MGFWVDFFNLDMDSRLRDNNHEESESSSSEEESSDDDSILGFFSSGPSDDFLFANVFPVIDQLYDELIVREKHHQVGG